MLTTPPRANKTNPPKINPMMSIHRSPIPGNELTQLRSNSSNAAPTIGPNSVPTPPRMTMINTSPDWVQYTSAGETERAYAAA